MIAVFVGLAVAQAADDVALRVIDEPLVGREVKVDRETLDAAEATFVAAIRDTWPAAAAAGDARTDNPLSASADPIVHVGLRVTRFEENRFSIEGEKTVEVLRTTVAPFAVDLGTGELIASAPYSFLVTGERLGTDTASDLAELRQAFAAQAIPKAVARFADVFAPGRLTASVLARDRQGAYIARGTLDGSFVGEQLRSEAGVFEVLAAGTRVSRVVSPSGAPVPAVGATLVKPGLARPLGKAPRVLVALPTDVPSLGPDPESVTMWVEEALGQVGWVIVPRGTELFAAQLEAATRLDIPEERLLNAQTPPEFVAIPRVWRLSRGSVAVASGQARLEVTAGLQVDVYDLRTGLLVQAIPAVELAKHDTRESVINEFNRAMSVSVVKDAAVVLASDSRAFPVPPLPIATIDRVKPSGVAWPSTEAPLPAGIIGEVRRPVVFQDPQTGEPLDGPAELIGTARVLGLDKDRLVAQWIAPGSAKPTDRFSPVGGRRGAVPVEVLPPTLLGNELSAGMNAAAVAGLHLGEGLQVVAYDDDAEALDEVIVKVQASGFAGDVERRSVKVNRTLATRFLVKVTEATEGKKKRKLTVRVTAVAEVTDAAGKPVLLKPPSADAPSDKYTMWTENSLEYVEKKGRSATVVDRAGLVAETVHRTATTLGTRIAVMLGD